MQRVCCDQNHQGIRKCELHANWYNLVIAVTDGIFSYCSFGEEAKFLILDFSVCVCMSVGNRVFDANIV